jgi:hypothetical protein
MIRWIVDTIRAFFADCALLLSFKDKKKEEPVQPCAYHGEPGCSGRCSTCHL